jgi:hypothetical protein
MEKSNRSLGLAGDAYVFVNRRSGFQLPAPAPRDLNVNGLTPAPEWGVRKYARGSLVERMAHFTVVPAGGDPSACWLWTGTQDGDGYGRICFGGREHQAHRVALELYIGRKLERHEVTRHGRDCSRLCVRGSHLQPGTVADNNRDKCEHGRQPRGEKIKSSKLTEAQVREIIAIGHAEPYEATGARFGVTGRQVANIVKGKRWAHVSAEARS